MALAKGKYKKFNLEVRSKKKLIRKELHFLSFNPSKLDIKEQEWILSIEPKLRGNILSKYYSQKASGYSPSSTWINSQVNNTCRWIKRLKKEKPMV